MFNIESLRAKRNQRLAETKSAASGNDFENLNTEVLPKGVQLWFPEEQCQLMMRVVQFEVSKKDNSGKNQVGDYVGAREYSMHRLPGQKKSFICPTTYGKPCPICDRFYSYDKEARKSFKGPANAFKPRKMVVFNALCKVASADGQTKTVMRVVRGPQFSTYGQLLEAVSTAAKFNPKQADSIFLFEDLELGYWFQTGFDKAPAVAGGTPFMHIVIATPLWQEQRNMISEAVFSRVTDLDKLIPQAPPVEELLAMLGDGASEFSKEVQTDEIADEGDFSDAVKGVAPAPAPAVVSPKDGDDLSEDDSTSAAADDFEDIGAETVPADAIPQGDFNQPTVQPMVTPAATPTIKPSVQKATPPPAFNNDDFDSFDN